MSRHLAARLLQPHRDAIARAVARQIRRTVPRYEQVDLVALERNTRTVLGGVQRLLEGGDSATLLRVVEDVAQLRTTTGFQASEFLVASMCFMPVVRRFLVQHAPSPMEGLLAWDSVEAIALPLFGQVVDVFLDSEDDDEVTVPSGRPVPNAQDFGLVPFTIETVYEEDSTTGR